ncbi:glycosyltransferase [Fusobacterium sp.]|uniref:glycosyltransferase n=1 Tax=Fusobacterium sp. TaxID=68766 RepID=UPI00396C69B4
MKKKLIIHNGNLDIGGQEKMLIQLLNTLDPNKYEVLLLIEENKGEKNIYLKDIPKWINYKFLTSEKFMMKLEKSKECKNLLGKIVYSVCLILKKKLAIKEISKFLSFGDIIIDYDMGLLRNLHKLNLKNKLLVGWSHAGGGELPIKKQKRNNLERYDYIIAINERMKKGYEKNTTHPQILKIYNFMDFSKILSESRIPLKNHYDSYILNIGSLTKNKNQELLIKAFYNIKKKYKVKEKLLLIGSGKEENNLLRLIKNLKLEKDVVMLGQQRNPYNYLKNALIYISCSKNEGFSLTCIEALVLGKMIIATETNGTVEILKNSEYGKIIPNNNIDSLEKNLYFFIKNDELRKKYEKKSVERAEDFSQKELKKIVEEFIDQL